MTDERIQSLQQKIFDYLNPSIKDQRIITSLIRDELNLDRCTGIIDSLITLKLDKPSIISFLCYQLFKTNPELSEQIKYQLTNEEKTMVETFKVIKDINSLTKSEEFEDIQNMFVALCKDVRTIIVKLCGILYDITALRAPFTLKDKLFVSQVRDIYIPLSERLGLDYLKLGMDDQVIRLEHPIEYASLKESMDAEKDDNEKQLALTKNNILKELDELNIKAEIHTRIKHISSIYKKLHNKSKDVNQIYDLVAMRVIVSTVEECYSVLGKVHSMYMPMPGRFKDYIASPKPNGYKSLHTTVIVENKKPMEIQIRTLEMHRENEFGAPAHWLYKENKRTKTEFDKRITHFREMLDNSKDLPPEEFVEALKADLYVGVIFVQTPKGRVIEFPDGATAIDFAYAIHSDIGNSCIGVKINGKMLPITTNLKNGDIVEVITSTHSKGPSRDWLNYAKTNSARSKIRSFFKDTQKEDAIKFGKSSFEDVVRAKDMQLDDVLTPEYMTAVLEKYRFKAMDELYMAIGTGSLTASQAVGRFTSLIKKKTADDRPLGRTLNIKTSKDGVLIDGDSGMLVRFAGCCNPIDGDEIIGYISRGKGVTIHRKTCSNVKNLETERIIDAKWSGKDDDNAFVAAIKIVAEKRDGNLAKFTSVITNMKVTISGFEARDIGDTFNAVIAVRVKNRAELNKVINLISGINGVKKVYRSEGWK